MNRPLTTTERSIIRWLLDHAVVGDGASYAGASLDDLRVVARCSCGCCSVDFTIDSGGAHPIADATATSDGVEAGLILWGKDGRIVGLELYDLHSSASHRLPAVADLRTWDPTERQ